MFLIRRKHSKRAVVNVLALCLALAVFSLVPRRGHRSFSSPQVVIDTVEMETKDSSSRPYGQGEEVTTKTTPTFKPILFHDFWEDLDATANATKPGASFRSDHLTRDTLPPRQSWLGGRDTNVTHIPPTVNKIYFQKRGGFPSLADINPSLAAAHKSWQLRNPGHTIRYYDLFLAREYLDQHFHPVFLRAFDCIEAFSGKSNLFRFALLYREGGWHSDWKQECLESNLLDTLASGGTQLVISWDRGFHASEHHHCIQSAFIGAIPGHPVIAEALELILKNVQSSHYGAGVLYNTGPCLLGNAFAQVKKRNPGVMDRTTLGVYQDYIFTINNERVVRHKCQDCGLGQDWENGNHYGKLHEQRRYYCEDASSLFSTSPLQSRGQIRGIA